MIFSSQGFVCELCTEDAEIHFLVNENEVAAPLCDSIAIVENTEVTLIFPVLFGLAGAE